MSLIFYDRFLFAQVAFGSTVKFTIIIIIIIIHCEFFSSALADGLLPESVWLFSVFWSILTIL